MSRSVKIVRAGTELRGGGRATSGQIVHVLDVDADEMVLRGDASELNTISQAIMPTPADGDVLTYVMSDSRWENKPAAGGSDPNPTFDSLHVTGASTLDGVTVVDLPRTNPGVAGTLFQDPITHVVKVVQGNGLLNGLVEYWKPVDGVMKGSVAGYDLSEVSGPISYAADSDFPDGQYALLNGGPSFSRAQLSALSLTDQSFCFGLWLKLLDVESFQEFVNYAHSNDGCELIFQHQDYNYPDNVDGPMVFAFDNDEVSTGNTPHLVYDRLFLTPTIGQLCLVLGGVDKTPVPGAPLGVRFIQVNGGTRQTAPITDALTATNDDLRIGDDGFGDPMNGKLGAVALWKDTIPSEVAGQIVWNSRIAFTDYTE